MVASMIGGGVDRCTYEGVPFAVAPPLCRPTGQRGQDPHARSPEHPAACRLWAVGNHRDRPRPDEHLPGRRPRARDMSRATVRPALRGPPSREDAVRARPRPHVCARCSRHLPTGPIHGSGPAESATHGDLADERFIRRCARGVQRRCVLNQINIRVGCHCNHRLALARRDGTMRSPHFSDSGQVEGNGCARGCSAPLIAVRGIARFFANLRGRPTIVPDLDS